MSDKDIQAFRDFMRKVKEDTQNFSDLVDLEYFRVKKASDYFNEKAQKNPATAEESSRLAKLFAAAAKLDAELKKSARDPSPEEKKVMAQLKAASRTLGDEFQAVNAYAFSKIDEFVAEDPARWARMEKNMPAVVAKVQQYKK